MALWKFILDHFKAIAFAEAGEFDTAKQMMESMPTLKERLASETKPSSLELTWAAVAFAEHGEVGTARELLKAKPAIEDHDESVQLTDRRLNVLAQKSLEHTKAAAFAEAGELEHAQQILRSDAEARSKILLIGYEARFPEKAARRAISLAAEKGYELIAVNVNITSSSAPESEHTLALRKHIKEKISKDAGRKIIEMAEAKGVTCVHIVEFGESEQVIKRLCNIIPGIEFVLTEREPTASEKQVVNIPVLHALAPSRLFNLRASEHSA